MGNKKSLITIAIPVYNRSHLFRMTLESALAQTYPNLEILVIDDCSKENIESIVSGYKDSRLRFMRNEINIGMVPNWNKCLKLAKGDIINILHSDDILYKNACEKVNEWFVKYPDIGFIYSGGSRIKNRYIPTETAAKIVLEEGVIIPSVFIAKKSIIFCGYFDEHLKYSSDMEYFPRIAKNFPVVCIEPAIALNKDHGERYQMKTWAKPDFLSQFEEVRLRARKHIEVDKQILQKKVHEDMFGACEYIFFFLLRYGASYRDRNLARSYFQMRRRYLSKIYGKRIRETLYMKKYYYTSFFPNGYNIAKKLEAIKENLTLPFRKQKL